MRRFPTLRFAERWLVASGGEGARRSIFRFFYASGKWGGSESASGWGSDLAHTAKIRGFLPGLVMELGIESLLDAPCGDFNWMRHVDLGDVHYTGIDIVPELIAQNQRRFADPGHRFSTGDITSSQLPRADMALCRDALVHLSLRDARRAIENFKRSATYLLTTTFPGTPRNEDIITGQWRPLDLTLEPFGFPPPLRCEPDDHRPDSDAVARTKSLGLWRLADVP